MKNIYIELVIRSDIENILYTFTLFIPLYTTVHCFAFGLKTGGKKTTSCCLLRITAVVINNWSCRISVTLDHYIYSYKGNRNNHLVPRHSFCQPHWCCYIFQFYISSKPLDVDYCVDLIVCFSSNALSALISLNSTLTPSGDSFLYWHIRLLARGISGLMTVYFLIVWNH